MSAIENTGPATDPVVLSAIMAAVRAYIDEEERSSRRIPTHVTKATTTPRAWKYAGWHPLRGEMHRIPVYWHHTI